MKLTTAIVALSSSQMTHGRRLQATSTATAEDVTSPNNTIYTPAECEMWFALMISTYDVDASGGLNKDEYYAILSTLGPPSSTSSAATSYETLSFDAKLSFATMACSCVGLGYGTDCCSGDHAEIRLSPSSNPADASSTSTASDPNAVMSDVCNALAYMLVGGSGSSSTSSAVVVGDTASDATVDVVPTAPTTTSPSDRPTYSPWSISTWESALSGLIASTSPTGPPSRSPTTTSPSSSPTTTSPSSPPSSPPATTSPSSPPSGRPTTTSPSSSPTTTSPSSPPSSPPTTTSPSSPPSGSPTTTSPSSSPTTTSPSSPPSSPPTTTSSSSPTSSPPTTASPSPSLVYSMADYWGSITTSSPVTSPSSPPPASISPSGRPSSPPTSTSPVSTPSSSPPTFKSSRLRLYWEQGYFWQEDWREMFWCMECGECTENDSVYIQWCDNAMNQQFVHANDTIRPLSDPTLCFTTTGTHDVDRPIELWPCSSGMNEQRFVGFNDTEKFELHPLGDADLCLSQAHHPKSNESLFPNSCTTTRGDTTNYWITF